MQYGEMQYGEMQYGEMQYREMQYGEMQNGEMQYHEMQNQEMQYRESTDAGEGASQMMYDHRKASTSSCDEVPPVSLEAEATGRGHWQRPGRRQGPT